MLISAQSILVSAETTAKHTSRLQLSLPLRVARSTQTSLLSTLFFYSTHLACLSTTQSLSLELTLVSQLFTTDRDLVLPALRLCLSYC